MEKLRISSPLKLRFSLQYMRLAAEKNLRLDVLHEFAYT